MQRKFKKNRSTDEISFWQSSSDLLTALLLVLLLIIILLIFYLMQIPDRKYIGYFDEEVATEHEEDEVETETEYHDDNHEGSVAHGGDDGDGDDDGDYPETEEGEYPYEDEGIKSAVYVMMVDGETDKTVKEKDVKFNLHDGNSNVLQILNTYYPERISYREFSTREDGTFYLPEKVYEKKYFFKALSEPEGYDKAEDYYFEIDNEKLYDWPDPYIVKIPVFPSRNIIRIQMNDSKTGKPVSGGEFDVIASEDIITTDGTLRYERNEVVDHIVCNEEGYGESKELYLGEYSLKETGIPEYYANVLTPVSETVSKKTDEEEKPDVIDNDRTQIVLTVRDKLTSEVLENAVYTVSDGVSEQEYTTNKDGQIILNEINKDATYRFTNVAMPDDYRLSDKKNDVKVSVNGRIGQNAVQEITDEAVLIRVNFTLEDKVLKSGIADKAIALFTENRKKIDDWVSNGAVKQVTGLEPGSYYLTIGEDEDTHYDFTVKDSEEIQLMNVSLWTVTGILVLVGIGAGIVGIIWLLIWLLRKLRGRKRK